MSRRASRKTEYIMMISLNVLGYQRLYPNLEPQIKFNWDISLWTCICQLIKDMPVTYQSYPGISLWYFVWNRILRVNLTKPDLYQLSIFPTEKSKQLVQTHLSRDIQGYLTNLLVLGICVGNTFCFCLILSYPWFPHLFLLNFGISRDMLGSVIKTGHPRLSWC